MKLHAALLFLLNLTGVYAHGRLTNVGAGTGTTRIGSATVYQNGPVAGGNTGLQWVCRIGARKASQADLVPGGKLPLKWNFGAAHVGDCAIYLSYDVDKTRGEQKWFKIANLYDCKSKNRQTVTIDIPPWLPAGAAVLRWDWYAIHIWPTVEFYSQCSDVTVKNNGQKSVMPKTYKVNTNTAYPASGRSGKGYRNPWDSRTDQSMTGPSCANGYTGNDCGRTAVGTKRNTIDGATGGGSSGNNGGGNGGGNSGGNGANNPPAQGGSGTVRCGVDWSEANAKCGAKCVSSDSECPSGEKCFADLDASKCTQAATQAPPQAPTKAPTQAKPVKSNCPNHVIKQGSTLSTIAKEYTDKGMSITWQKICSFNGIDNCDHIETGEVIIIPVGNCAGAVKDGVTQAAVTQAVGGGRQTQAAGGGGQTQAAGGGGSNLRVVVDGCVVTTVTISAGAAVLINMIM